MKALILVWLSVPEITQDLWGVVGNMCELATGAAKPLTTR